MKTVTIEATISVKINTGNFETIDVTKSMKCDVEYENGDELRKKQESLDTVVVNSAKSLAEKTLAEMGRKHIKKVGGVEKEIPTWGTANE